MFHEIPEGMRARMRELEALDAADRKTTKTKWERLRQVPEETGRYLALTAAMAPQGTWIEIGSSGGYSGMWLGLAAREVGAKLVTFELLEAKAALARESYRQAGLTDVVELVQGDAREHIGRYDQLSFVFLDAEKDIYIDCYDRCVPRMVKGGILIADNAINQAVELVEFIEKALADPRMDAMVVPIRNGEVVCRKRA